MGRNRDVKDGFEVVEATITHVPEISGLFSAVHIVAGNLSEKVDIDHPDSFAKSGGIFKMLDNSTLKRMMCSDEYDVLVAVSHEANEVIGCTIYHLKGEEEYNESDMVLVDHSAASVEQYARFKESLQKGKAACADDMITSPGWRRRHVCTRIQHQECIRLRSLGYGHLFYETYAIIDGESELTNPNRAVSLTKFHTHVVGYLLRKIRVGNRIVNIRSDFHVLDLNLPQSVL